MAGVKAFYHRARYLLADDVVTYEVGGRRADFHARSYAEFRRFQSLMGEEPILADLLDRLGPDDVFFDIGANVGTYSCFAAGQLDGGRVVAFEPEPANADRLRDNAGLNGRDIDLRRIALSDSNGTGQLERNGSTPGAGQHALARRPSLDTVEVPQSTGDRLVTGGTLPVPNVVKIDVEGAEMKVLDGLTATLARDACRHVYCEVHPDRLRRFDQHPDQLAGVLEAAGFTVSVLAELGDKFFIRADKPDVQ
jgi:FkbM family methyltransferase